MKPEFLKFGNQVINISQISAMRRTHDGFYVYVSGEYSVEVPLSVGKPLWEWLNQKAITTDQLPSL
jgi:hypothetical protein